MNVFKMLTAGCVHCPVVTVLPLLHLPLGQSTNLLSTGMVRRRCWRCSVRMSWCPQSYSCLSQSVDLDLLFL